MKHYVSMHLEAAKRALAGLFRQPIGSLLILVMLGVALTLPLALYLGVQSTQTVLGQMSTEPELTVFMAPQADAADVTVTQTQLKQNTAIKSVRYVPKDEALRQLQNSMGEQDLVATLDDNPLPDAFVIVPKSQDADQIQALQAQLNQFALVDEVSVDTQWLRTLFQIQQFFHQVVVFLAVTLCVAFVLVAYNTIRLQILSHKEEIEITKLLGAPAAFIRRPFLYQAWWQGVLAIGVSVALCVWVMRVSEPLVVQILKPYGLQFQWRFFTLPEIIIVVLLMTVLAVSGAYLATEQHLRAFKARA